MGVATMAQAAVASYYLESQRSYRHPTQYYTAGEEPDGVWFNPHSLLDLHDGENIDSKHFHRLYNGFHPETGEKLTRNAGSATRSAGLDITFSPDKSVSALWAIAEPALRKQIENAHNEAARMALNEIFLKECSYTRTRVGGADGDIHVLPANLLGAMFQHGTSRANDPQLHTHCVIFNAVETESDGKWRALHQKPLYLWIKAAGACYRSYLASNLTQLGIRMERYGRDNAYLRIKNMPEDLEKLWSKRRAEIVDAAAELGFDASDNSRRAEMLRVKTREAKRGDQEPERRHQRWRQECEGLHEVASLLASVFDDTQTITPELVREWTQRIDDLPHTLTRLEALFRTPDLAQALYDLYQPGLGTLEPAMIETALQRVIRNPDLVALDREPRTPETIAGLSHTVALSTRQTLRMEQETRELAQKILSRPSFALPAAAIEEKIEQLIEDDYPLSDEQTSAIRYVTGRSGGISVIEGAAGAGKTTTMLPIVDLYKQHGYTLIATAIANRHAHQLSNDCNIPPLSVDRLLKRASQNRLHLDQKSIILVEEAGMISTRHTHRLLKLAEQSGAKIIFLGDTQQQQPIEAGPGLRLVHDIAGSHRIDTIRRQLPDAEDILRDMHGLDPDDARTQAQQLSPGQEREILQTADRKHIQPHIHPWQIAASRNFKDGQAKEAIEAYRQRGRMHLRSDPETTVKKLVDDWHDFVTNNPEKTCIVLARTHQEIKLLSLEMRRRIHGDEPDPNAAVVTVSRGEGRHRHHYDLEIRIGDVLRAGGSNIAKRIFTGSLLTVEDLAVQHAPTHHEPRVLITARDEHGQRRHFYHDEIRDFHGNIRLDHGFALTMTSAQGSTVDRAFVLCDDAPSRETIYPAATRHRERVDFYISRDGPLGKIKINLPDQGAALQEPISDDDIYEHLAKRWSRHQPKEAASDYASEELIQEALAAIRQPTHAQDLPDDQDTSINSSDEPTPRPSTRVSANDNSSSLMTWATRRLRRVALDIRYGNTVALVAQGRREVMASYDTLRERARKEGGGVTLSAEYNNTLFRQAKLLAAAEPFRRDPDRFRDLLQRRGGLDAQDLDDFATQYGRARKAQQNAERASSHEQALSQATAPGAEIIDYETAKAALPEHSANRQSRSLPRAAELSAQLAERATDVCRHYLPAGKTQGERWQLSGTDGEPAITVNLTGADRGKWQDATTRTRGDLLDLIRHVRQYGSIGEAMKDATSFLRPEQAVRTLQPAANSPDQQAAHASARAEALYERAAPIEPDDPAAHYLASLGLDVADAGALRYHERAFYLVGQDLRRSPAIVVPLTATDGSLLGIEKLLLTTEGEPIGGEGDQIRSHSGAPPDAAARFGDPDAKHVAVCRSLPEALALLASLEPQEREQLAVIATPPTCDPARLTFSAQTRNVFLVQPPGSDEDRAWQAFHSAHGASEATLHRIAAADSPLDALLREQGTPAIRNHLRPLTDAIAQDQLVASLDRWQRDWNRHTARASAAHGSPYHMAGHDKLIHRLNRLRSLPATASLASDRLRPLDSVLEQARHHERALATINNHIDQVAPAVYRLDSLKQLARSQNRKLADLPSYPVARATAETLLSDARAIVADRETFGPALDRSFRNWQRIHDGIRNLADALDRRDALRLRSQPELYLPPIPETLPLPGQALEADASYRRLREDWQATVTSAEDDGLHPYDHQNSAALIDAMTELRDRPGLSATATRTLDTLISHHDQFVEARTEIDRFQSDWQQHLERAENAHAHPFYLPRHRLLIARLEGLMDQPAVAALPEARQQALAAVLDLDRRQTEIHTAVERYTSRIEPCLKELRDMQDSAADHELPLTGLPSYERWRETARPLLAEALAIAGDADTYGPCLEHAFQAWRTVHDGILKLSEPLGEDTTSLRHREPDLYLRPASHVHSLSDELDHAATSYRRLREQWHDHLAVAEERGIHPYRLAACDTLMQTMQTVRELPGLEYDACHSLNTLFAHHEQFHQARAEIDRHLDKAATALDDLARLNEIAQGLNFAPEKMPDYATRTQTALRIIQAGNDILADPSRYGSHIAENPDISENIRANIRALDRELSPETPPTPQPQLQETPEESHKQTIRRSRPIRP